MTADETLRRALPLARRVPISRIADISPLDPLGIPVFCAVTPLAQDLTTHLGKGERPEDAKASAVMEAIERVSAENPDFEVIQSTEREMRNADREVADRSLFELPAGGTWDPDALLNWVEGDCLLTGTAIWLPTDLVRSPPSDGVIRQVDTNGLASGNTLLEAVLHGICEVIERDAVSQVLFAECFAEPGEGPPTRRIDPGTVPERSAEHLRRIGAAGRHVVIDDLTIDVAVPVLRTLIVDPSYASASGPSMRVFAGYGCHPCAEIALNRSLTEAAQSLLAVVQGARDSFNDVALPRRVAGRQAALAALQPAPQTHFRSIPNLCCDNLHGDLDHVLGAIGDAGFENALAFDLTRRDLGIPVVRVRVPGMASFLSNRNWIGWRCLRWLQ